MRAHTAVLKSAWLKPAGLRLAGHDQSRGIGGGGFQRLPGEKHERGFQDGEGQRQKRRRDQCEFDGGGAVLLAHEAARDARRHQPAQTRNDFVGRCIKHGNRLDC